MNQFLSLCFHIHQSFASQFPRFPNHRFHNHNFPSPSINSHIYIYIYICIFLSFYLTKHPTKCFPSKRIFFSFIYFSNILRVYQCTKIEDSLFEWFQTDVKTQTMTWYSCSREDSHAETRYSLNASPVSSAGSGQTRVSSFPIVVDHSHPRLSGDIPRLSARDHAETYILPANSDR